MIEKFKQYIPIFEEKIEEAKKILILPHANPDGDAIGSVLTLYNIFLKMNKEVTVYSTPQVPEFLKWMPNARSILEINNTNKHNFRPNVFSDYDLILGIDFSSRERLKIFNNAFETAYPYKILIDHHPNTEDVGDLIFCEPKYSSTAEFIFDILSNSKFFKYFDKNSAACIYCGMMTDTGSFCYNSSNPNTYKIVSELLKFDIDKDKIYSNVYENFSINRMRFLGYVMQKRMIINKKLKTGYIFITSKDRERFKEQFGDTENFVNIPLSIKGIYFSAIFIERDNFIKISFRSKGTFPVNEFSSKHYNGGGHTNASGGESYKSLATVIEEFENLINTEYKDTLLKYKY